MSRRLAALASRIAASHSSAAALSFGPPLAESACIGGARDAAQNPWLGSLARSLMTVAEAQRQAANGAPAAAATAPAPAPAYKIAFVLGGPGSGKGTQCARLVAEFGVVHLSAGDLLRAHMASGSPEGGMVAEMIAQGQIVPSRVTVSLLRAAMDASAAAGRAAFLIDGFPRNDENRGSFEAVTGLRPACVLFFDCPEAEMTRRLLARQEGRTDDNEDTIRKRFRVYQGSTMPVIAHYEKAGIVARVGADRPVEEVYKEARRAYLELMT